MKRVLLAAVFVFLLASALLRRKTGYVRLLPAICLVALGVQLCGFLITARPVQALLGSTQALAVQVVRVSPSYVDGMVQARLKVTQQNGKALPFWRQYILQCELFPDARAGEKYEGSFALLPLEQNEYYHSALADGVYLQAQTI